MGDSKPLRRRKYSEQMEQHMQEPRNQRECGVCKELEKNGVIGMSMKYPRIMIT